MSSRSNGDSFTYDANGNMTQRTQNSVTWTQTFDAENRLVSVAGGGTTTTYVYDGSGSRVKRIVDDGSTTTTTIYVAGMEIEQVGGVESRRTIYYAAGGAFRVVGGTNPGLYFMHGDHLGSTSVLSDSGGVKVPDSDVVFAPYGEVRVGTLSTLTDFGFTGQRSDRDSGGLMYYGARYYLPGLNRFISADTIVPQPTNPQFYNRYSYVKNNPIKYIDPTGHGPCYHIRFGCTPEPEPDPEPEPEPEPLIDPGGGGHHHSQEVQALVDELANDFDVTITGLDQWANDPDTQFTMVDNIYTVVTTFAANVAEVLRQVPAFIGNNADAFRSIFGPTTFKILAGEFLPGTGGWLGKNSAYDANGIKTEDPTKVASNTIELSGNGLLGTVNTEASPSYACEEVGCMQGTYLVAHELAHNLTYRSINGAWDWFNGRTYHSAAGEEMVAEDFWAAYSQVRDKHNDSEDNVLWYEYSADLIADWAMGWGGVVGADQQTFATCAITGQNC